jgi:bifunctional UDP-N-acetylglucosamine pyrophosphorylase/glucosamine-1-phosphate N-acetyltransferase
VSDVVAVILAAGHGTRMRSDIPKPLHELCGRPMVGWPVRAALDAGVSRVVVVDGPERRVSAALGGDVAVAVQDEALGTGHAVLCAARAIGEAATVLVLAGDVPLVTAGVLRGLLAAHDQAGAGATMATMLLDDPAGYGRVVRDASGAVERVVETKRPEDATPAEREIREVNTGLLVFRAAPALDALRQVRPDNAQGEVFLPDALPVMRDAGLRIAAHVVDDPTVTLGVNDRADLAVVRAEAQRRIHAAHMRAGVTIVDPGSTQIDAEVDIGRDTVVEPFCFLRGVTSIGSHCRIGSLTTVLNAELGDGVSVRHAYLDSCQVLDGASVGPFAYLRPKALLREGAKVGTFVEVKDSDIGEGTKVPHLSYLGDTDVGPGTNLGAGTITANYDGRAKHRTRIGARVKGGVDTSFVAPVDVGDDAWTGAGSVITKDVPSGALAVARARQSNILDYARRVEERVRAQEAGDARATVGDEA